MYNEIKYIQTYPKVNVLPTIIDGWFVCYLILCITTIVYVCIGMHTKMDMCLGYRGKNQK